MSPCPDRQLREDISDSGLATAGLTAETTIRSFTRPPDDHPVYNLIGRVAAEWAQLEHTLDRTIWKLAKVPGSRGACVTAQMMGVWPRFNAIEALLTQRSGKLPAMQEFIKPVQTLTRKCRDTSEERNRIIHDPWYVDESGKTARHRSMPRSELVYGIKDHDRSKILGTIENIKRLIDRAEELRTEIFSRL